MAVYELNDGQLLRVARSINGRLEQRYFSLIGLNKTQARAVRREARELDELWAEAQQSARAKRMRSAATDKRHSTGVRGINLVRRPSPAFRVQVQVDGVSYVREFSIKRDGAEKAWGQAIRYLAEIRGYRSTPREWKTRMPAVTSPVRKSQR